MEDGLEGGSRLFSDRAGKVRAAFSLRLLALLDHKRSRTMA